MDDEIPARGGVDAGRLRQINRLAMSARLVAGTAHDLNNSLQVVGGLVELLCDRPDMPPDALVRVRKIGAQAEKAGSVIRHVLGYTRATPATGRGSLVAAVDAALALRRYQLGRTGITVAVDAPTTPVEVAADEALLVQVVLNLVVNAEEALAGQMRRELRVEIVSEDSAARLVVADTGHGVALDARARIFEPFFSTRDDERALGLGLTVARAIARSAGGDLTLEDPGPGSTRFAAIFPV